MTERLGDKLKKIQAAKAGEAAARKMAEVLAAEKAERIRHEGVRQKFEKWKQDIETAINSDSLPPRLRLAFVQGPDGRGSLISGPQNPDHDIYLDFQRWATEQGLGVGVGYADGRGGGGEVLTVSAKK